MLRSLAALAVATAVWIPNLHRFFDVDGAQAKRDGGEMRGALVTRARTSSTVAVTQTQAMRAVNPEWDFMTRTYEVLAYSNLALVENDPARRAAWVTNIDRTIDATLDSERQHGAKSFMLRYASAAPFLDEAARSLFIDGELLLMISARVFVAGPREGLREEATSRAVHVEGAMRRSPSLSGESYPNECWTFCNTTALAALAVYDRAFGGDASPRHAELGRAWTAYAREHLVERSTGLLVASYTRDGRVLDGPEGSSIFMSAHNLLLIDEPFARDQYARARRELGATAFRFGWAREWPKTAPGRADVDSGPIVPFVEASAGASGHAILGASAFGDDAWLGSLFTSLELFGMPARKDGALRYRGSNAVGDAVLLYAVTYGPLWNEVRRGVARPTIIKEGDRG